MQEVLDPQVLATLSPSDYTQAYLLLSIDSSLEVDREKIIAPTLINCTNGVIDLRNRKFSKHSPKYGFTDYVNAGWDGIPFEEKYRK